MTKPWISGSLGVAVVGPQNTAPNHGDSQTQYTVFTKSLALFRGLGYRGQYYRPRYPKLVLEAPSQLWGQGLGMGSFHSPPGLSTL
jgi:hypothetical protein